MNSSRYFWTASWPCLILVAVPEVALAQVADSWSISGDLTVSAVNSDTAISLIPSEGVLMSAPSIADGSRNTISASAVGATASVSFAGATDQDVDMADFVDGDVSLSAANLDSSVTIAGTIDGVSIGLGHDNTLAVSAIGASAQLGVTDDVLGGATVNRSLVVGGDIVLTAENSGAVSVQTDVEGIDIGGGTRNSFSATAIGASASVSVLAVVDDGAYTSDIAIADGGQISITANNSGDVLLGATDDPSATAIVSGATLGADSIDGTVSFTAIGASGSLSSNLIIYAGSAEPNVRFGEAVFDVTNSGTVQANVAIVDAVIDGKNSISASAIGTVVTNSAKSISYADDALGVTGTMEAVTFASANSGAIEMAAGLSNSGIANGFGLAITLNAIGATAAFSLP